MKRGDFTIKTGSLERVLTTINNAKEAQMKKTTKKMTSLVNVVWGVAHQRRPLISAQQARFEGRRTLSAKTLLRKTAGGKIHRVSDPNAEAGVPVAFLDGGTLQASIKKDVSRQGYKIQGKVWTNLFYAKYMEYGTSKIAARPFMRPAFAFLQRFGKEVFTKE